MSAWIEKYLMAPLFCNIFGLKGFSDYNSLILVVTSYKDLFKICDKYKTTLRIKKDQ